jgi:predicted MPP superfamily phosphohydrolase
MTPIILFIIFLFLIEIYSFFGLKATLLIDKKLIFNLLFFSQTLITVIGMFVMFKAFSNLPINQSFLLNITIGFTFSLIVAKLLFTSFFLVEDLLRGFLWLFQSAIQFRSTEFLSRSIFWGWATFIFGGTFMLLLNYGVWFGKYYYKVHHKTLSFQNLPKSFDGFKIVQISDAHLGTFDNFKKVKKGLELLQQQNPDIIVFTGDLVNNVAEEAQIYIDEFKKLSAPYGKFTILGNHDYGEYVRWKTKDEKDQNLSKLIEIGNQMGFTWLDNKHVALSKNNDTLYLAGVENWGLPPFPQYGNLEKAIDGISPSDFIILLSHDPTHWRQEVLKTAKNVALTLSGHTHGMQFGFELGKFKWSPVKYKYSDWADLYKQGEQYLYVNRGFGNIGYPGRVGIRPEITLIELKKTK